MTIRNSRRTIMFRASIAILICLIVPVTLTSSARADYSVTVDDGGVSVHVSGDFLQGVPNVAANNTADIFGSIPPFKFNVQGQNSSILESYISNAVRKKNPSATATHVALSTSSNGTSLHYDLNFNVDGVLSRKNGVDTVDLSWRSFQVSEDWGADNVSLNRVLQDYLGGRILLLAQQTGGGPLQQQRLWYLNDDMVSSSQIGSTLKNLSLFNFTSLASPLQNWSQSLDMAGSLVRYQASAGFNLTFIIQINEGGQIASLARDAIHKIRTVVEAPIGSHVLGDSVVFETRGAWQPPLLLTTIIASLGLLVATSIAERRVNRPVRPKARKSKR